MVGEHKNYKEKKERGDDGMKKGGVTSFNYMHYTFSVNNGNGMTITVDFFFLMVYNHFIEFIKGIK